MASITNWTLASGTGSTITCTLGFTPTAGRILLCCVGWDKSASSFTTPTGFTTLGQAVGASVSGAMFYKVATGSETSVAVAAGAAPTFGGNVWVGEVDAVSTLVDYTNPTYSDSVVTSVSTGTATGSGVAVAFATLDSITNADDGPPYNTWSNSFTPHPDGDLSSGVFWNSGGNTGQAPVIIAYKDVTGSASTTFTQSINEGAGDQMWAAIAIFAPSSVTNATPSAASAIATVSTGEGSDLELAAPAIAAAGTGAAANAGSTVKPAAGAGAATGAASTATPTVAPGAGLASSAAAGTAYAAIIDTNTAPQPAAATATGAATDASSTVKPNAGAATATAVAPGAGITSNSSTSVAALNAAAQADAVQALALIAASMGYGAATGQGFDASIQVEGSSVVAASSLRAYGPDTGTGRGRGPIIVPQGGRRGGRIFTSRQP